jgi:hypothetical protein
MILQHFIAVVDTQLLQGIQRKDFKSKDVEQSNLLAIVGTAIQQLGTGLGVDLLNNVQKDLVVNGTREGISGIGCHLRTQRDGDYTSSHGA